MSRHSMLLCACAIIASIPAALTAQQLDRGFTPYHNFDHFPFDSVNLSSGNLILHVPLLSYSQKGQIPNLDVFVGYTRTEYLTYSDGAGHFWWAPLNYPHGADIGLSLGMASDYVHDYDLGKDFVWTEDASGAVHPMGWTSRDTMESLDATAIKAPSLSATVGTSITDRNGIKNVFRSTPYCGSAQLQYSSYDVQDQMGNTVSENCAYLNPSTRVRWAVDTFGRTIWSPVNPVVGTPGCQTLNEPAPQGQTVPFTFCYSNHSISTAFQRTYVREYSGTAILLDTVTLPNLTVWTFRYNSWGDLQSITTPTGGTVTYDWDHNNLCAQNSTVYCGYIKTRSVNANDGTPSKVWRYNGGIVTDPDGNDTFHFFNGVGFETATEFYRGPGSGGALLKRVETDYSTGGGLPVWHPIGLVAAFNTVPIRKRTIWPTGQVSEETFNYDSGATVYDDNVPPASRIYYPLVYGSVVRKSESDYGNPSPGPILRTVNSSYLWQSNASYLAANILTPLCLVTVYGAGSVPAQPSCAAPVLQDNQAAQTTYGYDEDNGSPQGIFGNLTSITRWLKGGTSPKTQYVYDARGMRTKMYDPKDPTGTNPTQYAYDSNGYLSQIQYPTTGATTHVVSFNYDLNRGLLNWKKDENQQLTSYAYDLMGRLTSINYPSGGSETYVFEDSLPNPSFTYTKKITPSLNLVKTEKVDGLGRHVETQLTSDPDGTVYTRTAYDNLGRVRTRSNPFRLAAAPTDGTTTFTYDAIDRITQVAPPDGTPAAASDPCLSNNLCTSYLSNTVTVTDQAGKSRKSQTDALGHLTDVWEDPTGINYHTTYTYDSLDNLTGVVQNNSRARSFVYDSLSQLTSATNPESGLTCYGSLSAGCQLNGYDGNGNLIAKTDARGIKTTFTYDALNRLTSKSYTDSTPGVSYYFDGQVPPGVPITAASGSVTISGAPNGTAGTISIRVAGFTGFTNYDGSSSPNSLASSLALYFNNTTGSPVLAVTNADTITLTATQSAGGANLPLSASVSGSNPPFTVRLPPTSTLTGGSAGYALGLRTGMSDAAGTEVWSYDTMGRVLTDRRTTNGVTKSTAYAYNLDGSLATLTYPSGRTITYTPNAAGMTVSAVDVTNGINYALGASYAPQGALAGVMFGQVSGGFPGMSFTQSYNNRLQPAAILASSTNPTTPVALNLAYCFNSNMTDADRTAHNCTGSPTINNGNVAQIVNNKTSGRTENVTYDALNRVATAYSEGNLWGETFQIDAWGNLNKILDYAGKPRAEHLDLLADASNRFGGFSYDLAGNMLNDGLYNYTYNAEGQITNAATVAYLYDGDGKRVQKSSGKLYWYGMSSNPLDETDLAGNTNNASFFEYVFFGGKRIARRDFNNVVNYYFADHLGTARVVTDATGGTLDDSDFYPFGGERVILSSSGNNYKFTGKERDSESGNDNFGARYFSSPLGRFMSPDEFPGGPVDLFGEAGPAGPLPYADIANPQSLNKYSYTYNNPLRYIDPDGHDTLSFLTGLANSLYNNATLGAAPRIENGDNDLKAGQAVGDIVSTVGGAIETGLGAGIELGGLALDATGVGTVIGVPANVVGVGVMAHGSGMAATGAVHLAQDASDAYKATPENIDRMEKGKPPIGNDNHPVELHHQGGNPKGPTTEKTQTEHRLGDNYKKNHPERNKSRIDRNEAARQRRKYWKEQAEKHKEETK